MSYLKNEHFTYKLCSTDPLQATSPILWHSGLKILLVKCLSADTVHLLDLELQQQLAAGGVPNVHLSCVDWDLQHQSFRHCWCRELYVGTWVVSRGVALEWMWPLSKRRLCGIEMTRVTLTAVSPALSHPDLCVSLSGINPYEWLMWAGQLPGQMAIRRPTGSRR